MNPSDADSVNRPSESKTRMRAISAAFFKPVDIASIAVFRMAFGAILIFEVWRYFGFDWIRKYYIEPEFYFKYFGFEWVHPWPGDGMYYHFIAVAFFAFCVMTGFLYRVTSWLLFLGFTYWFLLDETRYLNHLYMTSLMTFLMATIPAHRAKSIDAYMSPSTRSDVIPAWCLWLLRAQVGIVYFFAGIAKINHDWLRGEPIRQWLGGRDDYPIIGHWLETESAVWFFCYGGLFFDLLIVPALLWKKTRPFAFAACVFFHMTNKMLFDIGIFPLLMLAATTIFFSPDWPRKVCLFFAPKKNTQDHQVDLAPGIGWQRQLVIAFFSFYVAIQCLVPLRHHLYPGIVHWTRRRASLCVAYETASKASRGAVLCERSRNRVDVSHQRRCIFDVETTRQGWSISRHVLAVRALRFRQAKEGRAW